MRKGKTPPRVSVVIPSYNHVRFVEQAIRSVMGQTLPGVELVIVDDGSRDGSVTKIESLLARLATRNGNPEPIFLQQENRGAHVAINRGLAAASGRHLAILNSDDIYAPSRLAVLLKAIDRAGTSLAFSRVRHIDGSGKALDPKHPVRAWYDRDLKRRFPTTGFRLLFSNIAVTTSNFVFSRELLEKLGGFRDFRLMHDYDFLLRSLRYSEPYFSNQALLSYRVHGSNAVIRYGQEWAWEGPEIAYTYLQSSVLPGNVPNTSAPFQSKWSREYARFREKELSCIREWLGGTFPG